MAHISCRASPVPTLEDFAVLCEVGRGAFGRVVLASCKATGDLRALKAVPKVRLVTAGSDAIRHMHDEAAIQRSIDHPFALALRGAFQDDTTVYLVTDHCPGGTLHAVLGRFGHLDSDLATFYAAQLVDVLAHLHTQDVAFRDVKPENALLDEKGYLRLADFGLARRVDGDDGRCRTRCGTPLYAAPEVILGRSHGRPVDAWALGCVIVEMRTGRPPFRREYCITSGSAGVGGGFKLAITARGSRQGTLSFVTGQEAGEPGEVRRGETPCGLLHDRLRGAAREANRGAVSTGHGSRRPGRVDPNAQGRHGLLLVVRVLLDAERRGVSQQAYSP